MKMIARANASAIKRERPMAVVLLADRNVIPLNALDIQFQRSCNNFISVVLAGIRKDDTALGFAAVLSGIERINVVNSRGNRTLRARLHAINNNASMKFYRDGLRWLSVVYRAPRDYPHAPLTFTRATLISARGDAETKFGNNARFYHAVSRITLS